MNEAVALAGEPGTPDRMRSLIRDLESNDPLVRLLAIGTLERETGETFGYEYYDPEMERQRAVSRWVAWLETSESP